MCVSKCSRPSGPRRRAIARSAGSVIEWSPPRTIATAPASATCPTVSSIAACVASGSAGITGASPKSTARSARRASTPASRCVPGGQLAARIARGPYRVPGPVGDEVVGRRADDRDVHALELGRVLGVREAAEGEEARVVRLVAEVPPAPERVDHLSIFPRAARIEAWNATLPSSEAARAATRPRSAPRSSAPGRSVSRRSPSSAARACASAASRRRRGCRPPSR